MSAFPERFSDRHVCVLGLGYVGLTLATVMAEIGFQVTGVEIREDIVALLRQGQAHFHETGIAPRLARVIDEGRLEVFGAIPTGCDASVWVITVGTPLDDDGRVRLDMVEHVSQEVASALHDGDLVVMRSTVKLGTTDNVIKPILTAGGKTFDLAFCPERTLEGQALEELRRLPQIVGGATHEANVRAAQLFQFVTPTVVRVSDLETAEMVKLVDNATRDVQFAYANEVARLCDSAGISAIEVIDAGKLGYPRTNLPVPGPVGGPCLSKDPYILSQSFEPYGVIPDITMTARLVNERQPAEVAQFLVDIDARLGRGQGRPVVTLLGIAFKGRPATDDLRGTTALPILEALREAFPDAQFHAYDPEVAAEQLRDLGLIPFPTIETALDGAHFALILNNHQEFSQMPLENVTRGMARPALIYDLWNTFPSADLRLPSHVGYVALGSHGRALLPTVGA